MLEDHDATVLRWPSIQIFLICEPIAVHVIMAPLDTFLLPIEQAGPSLWAAPKRNPTHIVSSIDTQVLERGRKSMSNYRDMPIFFRHFVEKRLRIGKKQQIAVNVRQFTDIRMHFKDIPHPRWRNGKKIFNLRSCFLNGQEIRVSALDVLQKLGRDALGAQRG